MKEIEILQALINDVKGNVFLGDAKNVSGYLKSMSLLADAMARRSWQQFELDVIGEIKEVKRIEKVADALSIKTKLARREFELADMQVNLMNFHVRVASSAFLTKEDAAKHLRAIADEIAAKESELFPKPLTNEEFKACAEYLGATYIDNNDDPHALLEQLKLKGKKGRPIEKNKSASVAAAT